MIGLMEMKGSWGNKRKYKSPNNNNKSSKSDGYMGNDRSRHTHIGNIMLGPSILKDNNHNYQLFLY